MLGTTKKEMEQILKAFFKKKFRGATKYRISSILPVITKADYVIYSFNFKCEHKREPYSLDYLIKFFLSIDGEQQARNEHEIIQKEVSDKSFKPKDFFLDVSKTYFDEPFLIVNKDEAALMII